MRRCLVGIIISGLAVLAGCATIRHLGGMHSPAMVVKMVELIKAAADNIEAVIILKMWWLIPACLLGLGAAAFLMVMKRVKLALGLAAAFGVTLVLSITVFSHFALIGYVVLGIGLLLVGYALYQAWVYREGFSQLFRTGELTKPELDEVGRDRVYGTGKSHGLAGGIQSKATEKLILLERQSDGPVGD